MPDLCTGSRAFCTERRERRPDVCACRGPSERALKRVCRSPRHLHAGRRSTRKLRSRCDPSGCLNLGRGVRRTSPPPPRRTGSSAGRCSDGSEPVAQRDARDPLRVDPCRPRRPRHRALDHLEAPGRLFGGPKGGQRGSEHRMRLTRGRERERRASTSAGRGLLPRSSS